MTNELIVPEYVKKLQEKGEKVTPLHLVTGGGDSKDFDWLINLNKGAVFLARPREMVKEFDLTEFHLFWKWTKSAKLMVTMAGQEKEFVVDSRRFSIIMELVEVIHQGGETHEE